VTQRDESLMPVFFAMAAILILSVNSNAAEFGSLSVTSARYCRRPH
jgi:hypothetical protein